MFGIWRSITSTLERYAGIREPSLAVGVESDAVREAIRIIQEHVDKEARNRKVSDLAIKDLCPTQKAELIRDLRRVLR